MILSYVTEFFFQIERVEVLSCQNKPEETNIHIKELEWRSMGGAACIAPSSHFKIILRQKVGKAKKYEQNKRK